MSQEAPNGHAPEEQDSSKGQENQVVENNSGSPDRAGASRAGRIKYKKTILAVCWTVLAILVFALYFYPHLQYRIPINGTPPKPHVVQPQSPHNRMVAPGIPMNNQQVQQIRFTENFAKPTGITADSFDLIYALPYDKRLVEGLIGAIEQYARFFMGAREPFKPMEVNVSRLNDWQYGVSFSLDLAGKAEKCELVLSNRGTDVLENIGQLEKELQRLADIRQEPHRTKLNEHPDYQALRNQVVNLISNFDYLDLMRTLQIIEQKVENREEGVRLFYSAGEIFSWLAFYKMENESRKLSDLLVTRAVSNYLLGCLDKEAESEKSFFEGLLLLALGYPAAAEKVLNPSQPMEQLLQAFIRYDFNQLEELAKGRKINKRLQAYLLARAFEKSGQNDVSNEHYLKLMSNYPDFLLSGEYVVHNARVGVSREIVDSYLGDLLEKHFSVIEEFKDTSWMARDQLLEQEVKVSVNDENRLNKWLKLHGKITSHPATAKNSGKILSGDFLDSFLVEDMSNALMHWYYLMDRRLAFQAESAKICEIAKAAYPTKPILKTLLFRETRDRQAQETFIEKEIQLENVNNCLLVNILDSGRVHGRRQVQYLGKLRDRENPDATGCFQLYRQYKALWYRPVAVCYLRNALALDPYNHLYYREMLKLDGGEEYVEQGKNHVGHLYGFLTDLAEHCNKNGKPDEAVAHLEKAIEKSPAQYSAYYELGKIYKSQGQFDKAAETLQAYLKYDTQSLSAAVIYNSLGRLYIEREEPARAYDFYLESQKTGQASAILGFAEASEKTGKILQAEKNYQKAAQRYPQGKCPTELGAFYLRQSNTDMALQVFNEYKRHNKPGYYMERLVDHCVQAGEPEKAMEIVEKLEGGNQSGQSGQPNQPGPKSYVKPLSEAYVAKKQHKIAASLMEQSLASSRIQNYWDAMVAGGLANPGELLSKGIPPGDAGGALWTLCYYLVQKHLYEESLEAFGKLFQNPQYTTTAAKDGSLVLFAFAWSMSGRNGSTKEQILSIAERSGRDSWVGSKVLFVLGDMDETKLIEQAGTAELQQGEAQYCLGLRRFKDGDKSEALKYFLMSLGKMNEGREFWHAKSFAKELAS